MRLKVLTERAAVAITNIARAGDNIVSSSNLYGGTYNQVREREVNNYWRHTADKCSLVQRQV